MEKLNGFEYEEDTIEVESEETLEEEIFDNREDLKNIDPKKMELILDEIYNKAVDGIPKVSRSVEQTVDDYLSKYPDPKIAAKEMAKYQIAKCGTSGFITGLGGLITLPVTIPANIGSVLYVQLRMIASIAKMGGFDIRSDQVQTMAYACLTGSAITDVIKQTGIKIGEKITEKAIEKIPGKILTAINQKVGFRMITKFGSKGAVNLVEMIPVAGGVVGGVVDVASTKIVAENAIALFIDRVMPEERKSLYEQVGEKAKDIKDSIPPVAQKGIQSISKATQYVGENAKPIAKAAKSGILETKDKMATRISGVSTSLKTRIDDVKEERAKIKMTVREIVHDTINEGKKCHIISSPKKILLSWDYFIDEYENKYFIEDGIEVEATAKKTPYEYCIQFKDQNVEFPEGTTLFPGEDKWNKKLPDSKIQKIIYISSDLCLDDMKKEEFSENTAEILIAIDKSGEVRISKKIMIHPIMCAIML